MMSSEEMINSLTNYDLKVGDKVYVLRWPNQSQALYTYDIGTVEYIKRNNYNVHKPIEGEKQYEACLRRYNKFINADEFEKYDIKVRISKNSWSIPDRKYLYMESEFDILQNDIETLNNIKQFKNKQAIELDKFIQENYPGWSLENSRRKVNNV